MLRPGVPDYSPGFGNRRHERLDDHPDDLGDAAVVVDGVYFHRGDGEPLLGAFCPKHKGHEPF